MPLGDAVKLAVPEVEGVPDNEAEPDGLGVTDPLGVGDIDGELLVLRVPEPLPLRDCEGECVCDSDPDRDALPVAEDDNVGLGVAETLGDPDPLRVALWLEEPLGEDVSVWDAVDDVLAEPEELGVPDSLPESV